MTAHRKIKVLGFMTFFYGLEYLKESLLSIRDHVDHVVIAITRNPSHGHGTTATNPDSIEEAMSIALSVLGGDKVHFDVADGYHNESQHRAVRYKYSEGFDLILTIDPDEVFEEKELPTALEYANLMPERYFGIKGYVNFWRSFDFACYDGFRPIRIENLKNQNDLQNINCPLTVYHFSTCQSEAIMRYKFNVFGHASEIKHNWLDEIHYAWTPENNIQDLHCVSYNLWNAAPFNKIVLPEYLKLHPNYNKRLV